jgi:hypothetical protein
MQKSPLNSAGLLNTYVKAKTTMFFGFAMEITKIYKVMFKLPIQIIVSSLLCVDIFVVKALRQWRQIWKVMKR